MIHITNHQGNAKPQWAIALCLSEWLLSKRQETRSLGYDVERGKLLCIPWWECKLVGNSIEVPQKLKIELPYDPAIPLLGIHLKKTKILIQKDKCTPMFTKMYAIVKSLCITPELTLYFNFFNAQNFIRKYWTFCLQSVPLITIFLSFQMPLSLVHFALQWIPQKSSLYCSNCSKLMGYHFSILVKILIVHKMSCCFRAYPYSEQQQKPTTYSTATTHKGQKPSFSIHTGARPKNAGAGVRKAKVFGTGGASIMWMI